ncbi:MAG: hypothetical protein CMJ24_01910 [Phycisphaerae bacterium]|nr:hypothetical protein [Phycisphaerae bacterium]|tara:strand:+ start:34490 stop:34834 length:345 start_codon:yes stop_codon:yes gene_type:complete
MQRPGTNPQDVNPEDILCDFCHRATWSKEIASIEGHHGSIVCSDCLACAWVEVVQAEAGIRLDGAACTMCLEERTDPAWRSPLHEAACICRRCIKLAGRAFKKDGHSDWVERVN